MRGPWVLAVLAAGQSSWAMAAPTDDLNTAVQNAFLVACMSSVHDGVPLAEIAPKAGLRQDNIPAGTEKAIASMWSMRTSHGLITIIEGKGPSRPCTMYVVAEPGKPIVDFLDGALSGSGMPFKHDTTQALPPTSMAYRWELGEMDLGAIVSLNPDPNPGQKPTVAASLFLEN